MATATLSAQTRQRLGKGGARQARLQKTVPAVIYGGAEDNRHLTLDAHELGLALDHHARIIEVQVDGAPVRCLVREVQRHPVSEQVLHLDLLRVTDGDPVRTLLPLRLLGSPVGVKQGGQVRRLLHKVRVECDPATLPDFYDVDITRLEAGRTLLLRDIAREGIRLLGNQQVAVVQITKPRAKS
jgi:large subunit ribosomal protein L25